MPTEPPPARIETTYPADYRAAEMQTLARAVNRAESLMVCGVGGSGKSHLLRFLAFHQAVPELVGLPQLARLYLDGNGLLSHDAAGVFQALLLELEPDAPTPADTAGALAALRRRLARHMPADGLLLLVIDRFERLPREVQPTVLDGLRHLRDYLNRRVCMVLGCRTPLPMEQLSQEFADLLAAPPVLWVGGLAPADAARSMATALRTTRLTLDSEQAAALLRLSGGYAQLLRAATLAWAEAPATATEELFTMLAQHQAVRRVCQALWADLPEDEQALLGALLAGSTVEVSPTHPLRSKGLVVADAHGRAALAVPLLAPFARPASREPALELTPLEAKLWEALEAHPGELVLRDALIVQLYGSDPDGVNDEALTALAARLRRKLVQAGMGTLEAARGRGYRFTPVAGKDGPQ
ncbi:MAG: winged helix-turn-helix domain-containing protein [Chloroflexaceae bacterium]|jgi:hypothetical protein|nr:winged helix-turn-helix domain-containing protein [Chloroflexaceae bacterium]